MNYNRYIELLESNPFEIDPDKFEILSTIRYDPSLSSSIPTEIGEVTKANFFLFQEHAARLEHTVGFFQEIVKKTHPDYNAKLDVSPSFMFSKLVNALDESNVSLSLSLRLRFLFNLHGEARIEIYETAPVENLMDGLLGHLPAGRLYDVYVDSKSVVASPFTSFKTTVRDHYTQARERILPKKSTHEEVLLVNSTGDVMEGSITNVAVRSTDGTWVTPLLTLGCLCGVTRNHLLRNNLIKEGTIPLEKLEVGQEILLTNAVLGVTRGVIREIAH